MSKLNKILCIILVVSIITTAGSLVIFGDPVVTVVKNIIDKWFVNGVEVTEAEFEAAQEIQYEDYIIEHHLTTGVQYKINGVEVSEQEALNYIEAAGKSVIPEISETKTVTLTISAEDLTGINAAAYVDYLYFENGAISVKSNKVKSITYKYNAATYLTYTSWQDDGYYYTAEGYGYIYRDISAEGMVFKVGKVEATGFYVCDIDHEDTVEVSVGDYVYKFVANPNYADLKFSDVFESITLNIIQ